MRTRMFWVMVVINVVLGTILCWRLGGEPAAVAQTADQARVVTARPSEFLMIPAKVSGVPGGIVYVLDMDQQMLGATYYDINKNQMESLPTVDLATVFDNNSSSRRR